MQHTADDQADRDVENAQSRANEGLDNTAAALNCNIITHAVRLLI